MYEWLLGPIRAHNLSLVLFLSDDRGKKICVISCTVTSNNAFLECKSRRNTGLTQFLFPFFSLSLSLSLRWWLQEDLCDIIYSNVKQRFPRMQLKEKHGPYMVFQVKFGDARLSDLFEYVERNKQSLGVTHYSISQTGLEQIFNKFAAQQVSTG